MSNPVTEDARTRDVRGRHVPGVVALLAIAAVIAGWAGGLQLFGSGTGDGTGPSSVAAAPSSPGSAVPAGSPGATPAASGSPSAAVASPSPSEQPSTPATRLDPVFGMSGHLMWHDVGTAVHQLDMLAQDGLGVVRFDVSWRNMEPTRGTFRYLDKLDQIVDAAVERGIMPIASIVETPGWANGDRSLWVPPDDPRDYAAFAGMLAGRYAGRVRAWEVWNEPDSRLFWRPDPDPVGYTKLLLAGSAAIRAADPGALVIGGSITFGNTTFVEAMYENGAKGSFDALSVHPYTLTRAPDDERDRFHSVTAILDDVHAAMDRNGDGDTPIWVTELGWATVGLNSVSVDKRVDYLAASVELIRARPFVRAVTIYTVDTADSERYGLSTSGKRSAAWRSYVQAVAATSGESPGG
jgi:hypothetical protein